MNITSIYGSFINKKGYWFILVFLWSLLHYQLFHEYGIITTKEATKYFYEADYFKIHHHFSEIRYIFYSGYIFLHSIFEDNYTTSVFLYTLQLILNLIGLFSFVRLAAHITGSEHASFIAGFILLAAFNWQIWTVYLYTESLFCNYIIIFCSLFFAPIPNQRINRLLLLILFVLILFTRPHGMLLLLPLSVTFFSKMYLEKKYIKFMMSIAALCVSIVIAVWFFLSKDSGFDFIKPIAENSVLCYIKTESLQTVNIKSDNALSFLITYIYNYPKQFIFLSVQKFLSYWGITRSYFSPLQNSWIVCFYYSAYFFALIGIYQIWKKNKSFILFIISLFWVFTFSVIMTCDDWSNRFNMPIIPFVLLLAGYGLMRYIQILRQPDE